MCDFRKQVETLQQNDGIQLVYLFISPVVSMKNCIVEPFRRKEGSYSSRLPYGKFTLQCTALSYGHMLFFPHLILHCSFCQFQLCFTPVLLIFTPILSLIPLSSLPSFQLSSPNNLLLPKNATNSNHWAWVVFHSFFSSKIWCENKMPAFQHMWMKQEVKFLIAMSCLFCIKSVDDHKHNICTLKLIRSRIF